MRILIISPRAAALCMLFPQGGNDFSLCASFSQMRQVLLSFAPHLILLDEDMDNENAVDILTSLKSMIPPSTCLTTMTRQAELSGWCQRTLADAFI